MASMQITVFNKLMMEIVEMLADKFPMDKDVDYAKSQLEIAMSVSTRSTISTYMETTRPYLEKILNKDEDFFLEKADKTSALRDLGLGSKWRQLTPTEKSIMWRNIQKMIVLGNKILTE